MDFACLLINYGLGFRISILFAFVILPMGFSNSNFIIQF